jgi:hypothetical protein
MLPLLLGVAVLRPFLVGNMASDPKAPAWLGALQNVAQEFRNFIPDSIGTSRQ